MNLLWQFLPQILLITVIVRVIEIVRITDIALLWNLFQIEGSKFFWGGKFYFVVWFWVWDFERIEACLFEQELSFYLVGGLSQELDFNVEKGLEVLLVEDAFLYLFIDSIEISLTHLNCSRLRNLLNDLLLVDVPWQIFENPGIDQSGHFFVSEFLYVENLRPHICYLLLEEAKLN